MIAPVRFLLALAVGLALPASAADRSRPHAEDARALPPKAEQALGKAAAAAPSHVARDGGLARELWIEADRVAEFPAGGGGRPVIRAARPGELADAQGGGRPDAKASPRVSNGATGGVSPLFKDAAGQPRALPGGVIVGMKEALPADEASARLAADGLTPVRQINARMWLVESPVGLASLDLANRLQESGRYDFAQPNWWKPRATK